MELILRISYELEFENTKDVQSRFREELGLNRDNFKQIRGDTNGGNTSRRFFQNFLCASEITGTDEGLIKRFYVILEFKSSRKVIN